MRLFVSFKLSGIVPLLDALNLVDRSCVSPVNDIFFLKKKGKKKRENHAGNELTRP